MYPHASYLFKHALIQDAAYGTLLREPRRGLHAPGQRSLERSALFEAVAQFTRALDQIATLPGTPTLRREQIKLQVALITPLLHIKGQAAPETKAAVERAHVLI